MTDVEQPAATNTPYDDQQLQTPEEIGREYRASARTVRRWIALGILPALRIRRRWLVRRRDALALLKAT